MSDLELEYIGLDLINFKDGSYRWVSIKHFLLPDAAGEQDSLALPPRPARRGNRLAMRAEVGIKAGGPAECPPRETASNHNYWDPSRSRE